VLVGVDVKVVPQGQDPVVTRQRLQLEMTRTDTGWKASRLAPVNSPAS
jgi:Mce-associated membrane protein